MKAVIRRSIGFIAAVCALAAVPSAAGAATAYPGIDYRLDGSPAPVPPSLNQLNLYTPDGTSATDSRPVVVYVHGGGWRTGDKSNKLADKIALFTGAGYVFASVNYRLSPDPIDTSYPADRIRFPTHPQDVGESIAWIDRNVSAYGGDPSRILLIGHSAGAHLVALVSTDPSYIEAFGMDPRHLIGTVPLDGDGYDVTERIATGSPQAKSLYYNAFATPAENAGDDTWAQASPINFAGASDPDFFLVTQAGAPARAQNADEMATALGQDAATSVFRAPYDHEGINQAVGDPNDGSGETQAIMDFFARMVAASRPSEVTIGKRPGSPIKVKRGGRVKVRFRFAAVDAAASFQCRLDDRDYRRCASPATYKARRGRHTFRVRAVASNGALGPVEVDRFKVIRRKRAESTRRGIGGPRPELGNERPQ